MTQTRDNPARHFGRLRRSLKRYRAGVIDAEVLAQSVEHFLAWDRANTNGGPEN